MALSYLSNDDFAVSITDRHLAQILDGSVTAQADAESMAIAAVKDALLQRYDTDALFADRVAYPSVRRWVSVIAVYYLYQRVPDDMIPERIIEDYEAVIKTLGYLADGKRVADLPSRQVGDPGATTDFTSFRGGFHHRRSH